MVRQNTCSNQATVHLDMGHETFMEQGSFMEQGTCVEHSLSNVILEQRFIHGTLTKVWETWPLELSLNTTASCQFEIMTSGEK